MKLRFAVPVLIALVSLPALAAVDQWSPSLMGSTVAVAIDPTDSATAYAATWTGVFKTTNRGEQWTLVGAFPATAVAIDPRHPATVILSTPDAAHPPSTFLRMSDDGGLTWQDGTVAHPSIDYVSRLTFDPAEPGRVYAAVAGTGIATSADGGKQWTMSNERNGLDSAFWANWSTTDVATTRGGSPTVYAASRYLFRSTDGATSWQRVDIPRLGHPFPFELLYVSVDPNDSARLYAGGYFPKNDNADVLEWATLTSADGGTNWRRLPTDTSGRVTIDPHVPRTLYTFEPAWNTQKPARGVLRSDDQGETWSEFNSGLTFLDVTSINMDATGTLLYAVTSNGIFVLETQPLPRRRAVRR